jgi:FAD dependent oxidoreductase/S-layer homology domain
MIRLLTFCLLVCSLCCSAQTTISTDVLVIGGGTGGTAAGIQSARSGARTVIMEAGPWLGGMISNAGVTATDGNHYLPSGLWNEFRNQLYKVYGGPAGVATGWVSLTQFEPHVADSIFKTMAAKEKLLSVQFNETFQKVNRQGRKIQSAIFINNLTGKTTTVIAKIFIDATELGDALKSAGVPYDLGMEANAQTHENVGVSQSNDIVQDLTWVATLKDYGVSADRTIVKPANYNPHEFDGACTDYYHDTTRKAPNVDGKKMLAYGKLPHNKYMINWPGYGNDTYLNVVELNEAQRDEELLKARQTTLRFVYFIQHELGFKHLGLADDEFPTKDSLALIAYHREGRRVKGLVRLTIRHLAEPFTFGDPLYRTGVAVGDYPIDHHHRKNASAPQHLDFYPIPSFSIPLGALITDAVDNLVVAEKAISVSNVVNGTTRLQPCVLLTGQAAGMLAALSCKRHITLKQIAVRDVQQQLLTARAYIMPFTDVASGHPQWEAIQKIGATGILRGVGEPSKWANKTWFYPDSLVSTTALQNDLKGWCARRFDFKQNQLTIGEAIMVAAAIKSNNNKVTGESWKSWGLSAFDPKRMITRAEFAQLLNKVADPFTNRSVTYKGELIQ